MISDHMHIPKVTFSFPDAMMYEHAKNQHSFILEIQQIMESHDLKGTPIFDLAYPITWYILSPARSHSLKLESHAHF